jgi:hypothetical protein
MAMRFQRAPEELVEPWTWYLRRRSRNAWRRLARLLGRPAPPDEAPAPVPPWPPQPLVAGDLVRVRPAEEIRRTLDGLGRIKGCSFAQGMYAHCGQERRVARVVTRFFDERHFRMLRARDLVILEGVHCDGADLPDTQGCDRQCYYFWRTEWLEKVAGPGDRPPA